MVAALAACSGGGDDNGDDSGLSSDSCNVLGLKIINGTECGGVERSAVVELEVFYTTTAGGTACSGTMITPTDVLTAGHCFIRPPSEISAITVRVGGQELAGEGVAIHPGFREGPSDFEGGRALFDDAAIVRLATPASVATLPLQVSTPLSSGDIVSIFGYGFDEDGDAGSLRSGEMLVDRVSGGLFSANFTGDGSNTCQGDSGGPALVGSGATAAIVGLTSSGLPDAACREGDVSLFTYVQDGSILDFIRSVSSPAER